MNAPAPRTSTRVPSAAGAGGRPRPRNSRAFWLKHLSRWHWISSAVSLAGLLMFAATGITLNHAADIGTTPRIATKEAALPRDILAALKAAHPQSSGNANALLPPAAADWLTRHLGVRLSEWAAEWSPGEVYLSLPRPGGDGWLAVDLADGSVTMETTDRGWIAYLNDLHKGRNTGAVWFWFIDVFAGACVLFAATGFLLLAVHSSYRPGTWPVVGIGVAVPLLLMVLFIH